MRNTGLRSKIAICTLFILAALNISYAQRAQSLYWEEPKPLLKSGARFVNAFSGGGLIAVVWQEFISSGLKRGEIYLSIQTSRDAKTWRENRLFAGPYPAQKREAPIFSLAVNDRGRIFLAIVSSENTTEIWSSTDDGQSFQALKTLEAVSDGKKLTTVAPSIFLTASGNLLLFVTQTIGKALTIQYSVSRNGFSWTEFKPLVTEKEISLNFLPNHASLYGQEYVVFQGIPSGAKQTYQLYLKTSSDGGYTWSPAISLGFRESVGGRIEEENKFINQRPFITSLGRKIGLAWERQYGGLPPRIYYAEVDTMGKFIRDPEAVTEGASAHFPQIIQVRDQIYLFWFDNRRGKDHIFISQKRDLGWDDATDLSNFEGTSTFARPVRLGDYLYVFWENRVRNTSMLILLQPDQNVIKPRLLPVNFNPERESKQDEIKIRWSVPRDPSGIDMFTYTWSQDPAAAAEEEVQVLPDTTSSTLKADKDGTWYFTLAALDYAGNRSEPATIFFTRDTTPPGRVDILRPEMDEEGFLLSNTFKISWRPSAEEDVAGYSYSLQFLGSEEIPMESVSLRPGPERVMLTDPSVTFNNRDNGFWALSVTALDSAGNVGKAEAVFFELNKYIPVTYITYVDSQRDPLGNESLRILGRGFAEGGLIHQVILDRDGGEPYDYLFSGDNDLFKVKSDRIIDNLSLVDLEEGMYRVGLIHPTRGVYFSTPVLKLASQGTVKFGNFDVVFESPWEKARLASNFFTINKLVIWLVVGFLGLLAMVSIRKMASLAREGQILKGEIIAVLQGERRVLKRETRMRELERKGIGLRLKFTLLIMILVIITVLMVSIPLIFYMTDTQQKDLAEGLVQRTELFLGSLASGAESNLPRGRDGLIELGLLVKQISVMEEAVFATIAGVGENDPNNFDYVWATNDVEIQNKIAEQEYEPGQVRIEDEITPIAKDLEEKINIKAKESVSPLSIEAEQILAQFRELDINDPEYQSKLEELQAAYNAAYTSILDELRTIGLQTVGSLPEFNFQKLEDEYTFYRPIVYRVRGEDIYYRGIVRLRVSTDKINAEIKNSRRVLRNVTGFWALIAAGMGLLGAIIMASITITPIKKLAAGVAVIRDAEDKEDLKEHRIDVRSRDEIGTLATTVNQMIQGLVKAAAASKDLTVGKEVQKMFIPLSKDPSGKMGSTAAEKNDQVEIYGYYEGAKGVSGDYFYYEKLSDKYYAMIKCDVAGKGVPAALIMVEVATIFFTFFRKWTLKDPGLKIDALAYQINDMLEERAFKGRFAALTLCIINIENGKAYFCNAGDTDLHMYNKARGKMVVLKLPEAPAAGVFPSMLVEMKSGFQQVSQQLNPGDTLFMFTDGVEEAKRTFRDEEFKHITCNEPGLAENEEHGGTHLKGSDNEELGNPRIHEIINSVFNQSKYRLAKYHNPLPGEELTFDFTKCEGSVEDAVLALVAVEKVFRIYPDPGATSEDEIKVDKSIDQFLSKCFEQYSSYFTHRLEPKEEDSAVTYTHLKEDEQYDDLTILAVRKI